MTVDDSSQFMHPALNAALDPWRDLDRRIRLRCGKALRYGKPCRRVFGFLAPHYEEAFIYIEQNGRTRRARGNKVSNRRPSMRWKNASPPETTLTTRVEYPCKCGARYVVKNERLVIAYIEAAKDGKDEVFLGVDL